MAVALRAGVVLAVALAVPAGGQPSSPKRSAAVPPHEVLDALLAHARDGRLDRFRALAERAGSVVAEAQTACRPGLAVALRGAQDPAHAQDAALRLGACHIRALLGTVREPSPEAAAAVRAAFFDFAAVEPALRQTSPEGAARAHAAFRAAYRAAHGEGGALEPRLAAILALFPEER